MRGLQATLDEGIKRLRACLCTAVNVSEGMCVHTIKHMHPSLCGLVAASCSVLRCGRNTGGGFSYFSRPTIYGPGLLWNSSPRPALPSTGLCPSKSSGVCPLCTKSRWVVGCHHATRGEPSVRRPAIYGPGPLTYGMQLPRPALLWPLWAALRAGAGVGTGTSWTGAYHGKLRELSPAIYGGEGAY